MTLRIVLRCLPELTTADIVEKHRTISLDDSEGGKTVKCPSGYRVISGGAFWSTPGVGIEHKNAQSPIANSTPTGDARGWFASGVAFSALDLVVEARCMRAGELAGYTLKRADTAIGSQDMAKETSVCPHSNPAVGPAGAFVHQAGHGPLREPSEATYVISSGVLEAVRKFGAAERTYTETKHLVLTARAFCLHK